MNRKIYKPKGFSFHTICLLVVLITTATGCVSPKYRLHPELLQRKNAIRTVGLLPPMVTMYKSGLVVNDNWSHEARESLRKAFVDEMAAVGLSLTPISGESREANDIADLSKAVDFSIGRHAYDNRFQETFREQVLSFDYSLGSTREMMERHQVDVVWVVTGYNLPPTPGRDALAILLTILLNVMGPFPGPMPVTKIEFRAALVDKSGTILFYYRDWPPSGDLRDPRFARERVRELLSEYRMAVAQ